MKIYSKYLAMAIMLAFLVVYNTIPAEAQTQGAFPSGVTWAIFSDGTLRISGNGPMPVSLSAGAA